MMTQTFNCPSCGGSLDYDGRATTVRCPYCSNTVIGPEAIRETIPAAPKRDPLVRDPSLALVADLLREGKRVQATIQYRQVTGATLKQAQIAIEQYLAGMPLKRPR